MQGWAHFTRPSTSETIKRAALLFEEALKLDPDNNSARLGIARTSYLLYSAGLLDDPKTFERAEELTRRVISQDPTSGRAYNVLGDVLTGKKQFDAALLAMRKAVELNPSDAGGGDPGGGRRRLLTPDGRGRGGNAGAAQGASP
jgi:cytochrome c-type biogenesis protein CcmH/NrfG